MLIAIDIGNTNIVIGGIQGDAIQFEARIATDRIKTSDQYGVEIKNILALFGVKPCDVDDCIISSVVPPVFNSVYTGLVKMTGKHPLVVGPGIKTGLNIQMDVPSQVGSDRIVIAVAALAEYEPPLILMDLGTATTIEVVDRGSTYLGGCIIPGVRTSLDALTSRAAQLPGIRLDRPGRVIGKNTVDCMRSGIMYGTAAMLDGMLDRVEEELGSRATVVATGGMAQFIVPLCRREIKLEKDLLLKGLNIIYQKNAAKRGGGETRKKKLAADHKNGICQEGISRCLMEISVSRCCRHGAKEVQKFIKSFLIHRLIFALAQINISVFENRYISDLFKLIIYLVKPDLIYMLSGFKSTHTERGAAVSNVQCIDHFDQRGVVQAARL